MMAGRCLRANGMARFARMLALCLLLAGPAVAAQELLGDAALVAALRGGGHNLYFRHVGTTWSQHDQVLEAGDWRSCDATRMRQLSQQGRDDAKTIGSALRRLEVPVGEVMASPYCRTVETARLMQLGDVIETTQVMNLLTADYIGGRASVVASAQALLASPPPSGNRVIVAHGNVAREATPAYPAEGEALVFAPDGEGGFILRARIAVSDWSRLLSVDSQ
jgi:broad specificity phosphatase PhoE